MLTCCFCFVSELILLPFVRPVLLSVHLDIFQICPKQFFNNLNEQVKTLE